jgi:hypothetical protein
VTPDAGAFAAGVDRDARRALVAATAEPSLDGIDFVEVLSNQPGTRDYVPGAARQRTLLVHLLNGPVPADLRTSQVVVLGGVRPDARVNPVRVEWAYPAADLAGTATTPPAGPLPGVTEPDRDLVRAAVPAAARERVLAVRTSSSGDWSTYLLRLLGPGGTGVPSGFDQPLAQAPFSFTVDCPSDLDCRPAAAAAPRAGVSPLQDYLARDFAALRTRLTDRLATLLPDWTDRNPADLGVTLTELFAYLGDRLAYWQDAAGAEAYLGTARRRTSVRRHARLLDYRVHEGCSARTWLVFITPATLTLAAGTVVTSAAAPGEPALDVAAAGGTVFATCAPATLRPERDRLLLHSWGDPQHCLPAGSTSAFITASADPGLLRGDVVVLTGFDPAATPLPVPDGGDPALRHAVRLDRDPVAHTDPLAPVPTVYELHWFAEDALVSALPVTRPAGDGSPEVVAVAWANVALADHGATVDGETLDPPQVPAAGRYRPRLRRRGLTWAQPYDTGAAAGQAAALALRPDPRLALAQAELDDGRQAWQPRPDLLASAGLDPHFVVEPEDDGTSQIRFGDGILGRPPAPAATLEASYRIGGGAAGNVAAGVLTNLIPPPGVDGLGDVSVSNPLPAAGGQDPQPVAEVRELAPHAFRTQLRAVTPQDYAEVAMEHPGVQRAVARRRWTGSWYAVQVTIDPLAAYSDDPAVPADAGAALEVRRMAGMDVEVARPVYVPLDIVLSACVAAGYQRADVAAQLREALSAQTLPDGRRGFFHPDNFTFGQPLYLSDLVAAIMAVPGVAWVDAGDTRPSPDRFGPLGRPPGGAAAAGVITADPREVLRADSDPSNPENGRVEILLRGGS